MTELLHGELTYRIRAALWKVHRSLGPGFREETYRRTLILELKKADIPFQREKEFSVTYDGQVVDTFRVDLLVDEKVILELKAVEALQKVHESQLFSYLKASCIHLGLLVNFGQATLQIARRIV